MADAALSLKETVRGKTLREGIEPLEELSKFFHAAGYAVYVTYDDTETSPRVIKRRVVLG